MSYLAVVAYALMLLISSPAVALVAQDTIPDPPRPWLWLPLVTGAPETGFGGGVVAGWFEGGGVGDRPSSVIANVIATSKGNLMLGVVPELYLDGGRVRIAGNLQAQKYPDAFFGTGAGSTEAMEEAFTSRTVTAEVTAQREVGPGYWVGGLLRVRHDRLVETEDGGLLSTGAVAGSGGGVTSGAGLVGVLDSRDDLYNPHQGAYGEIQLLTFDPALGSDYRFDRATVDLRRYLPVGTRTTLAVRAYAAATTGEPPFQELPGIGSTDGVMRGYRDGRYRDRAAASAEVELRFPLVGRFGATVFGGVGDVGPDLGSVPTVAELERALGAGLRFRLNEGGVNLRLDYGVGREGGGLYLGIGEAF